MNLHVRRNGQQPPNHGSVVEQCRTPDCLATHWQACTPCWRDRARLSPTRYQLRGVWLCQQCEPQS